MNYSKYRLLIVDDEPDILEFLRYNLEKEDFQIFTAKNGNEAIDSATKNDPHLILLDVMMPGMDGIETCQEIRKIPGLNNVLIAFLTARAEDYSQIAGFEAGGDDYIAKPIKPKLLVSRIKALLKRYKKASKEIEAEGTHAEAGDIFIDKERYLVILKGEELFLPKKEFELLSLLISKPEKVFSREEIFRNVWGDNIIVGDRTIDVHIRKLREKLGEEYFKTVKGVGYKYSI